MLGFHAGELVKEHSHNARRAQATAGLEVTTDDSALIIQITHV